MNEKRYVCSLCGKQHHDLDAYINCVSTCGSKLKKEQEEAEKIKRMTEINAALNAVKQAKKYYEDKLEEFKTKYPEEYKTNFVKEETKTYTPNYPKDFSDLMKNSNIFELSYERNGDNEPTLTAKVNGNEVKDDALKTLSAMPYVAKLLNL